MSERGAILDLQKYMGRSIIGQELLIERLRFAEESIISDTWNAHG